jgi:hypothetical protein
MLNFEKKKENTATQHASFSLASTIDNADSIVK